MYSYNAKILRWVDGDTFEAEVDLGFFVKYRSTFRVRGIDTPELVGANKAAGMAAKAFAEGLIPPGETTAIKTYKPDKYGRWLADLFVNGVDGSNIGDFGEIMVASGMAVLS